MWNTEQMKYLSSLFLTIVVGLGIFASTTHASTTVKAGATCAKLNQSVVVGGYKYTCSKSGSKLLWKKGAHVPIATTTTTSATTTTTTTSTTTTTIPGPFAGTMPAPSHVINLATPLPASKTKFGVLSFEIPVSVIKPDNTSNFKAWIYDPANKQKALGSGGIRIQKNGGDWYYLAARSMDGSFDTHLDPGTYVIEPQGTSDAYFSIDYQATVASDSSVSINGVLPNSKGYFTLTAALKNSRTTEIAAFKPTSACQLLDQSGSPNLSNGFPRATGRLPNQGTVRALIIPVDFTDLPGSGDPRTNYLELANGTADFYYKESSHRVRFEFSTLSTYVHLNVPVGTYKLGSSDIQNGQLNQRVFLMDALTAAGSKVDLSQFDIAYVLPPSTVTSSQIAVGTAFPGYAPALEFTTSYGQILNAVTGAAPLTYLQPSDLWRWMAHETGHTFGLFDWYITPQYASSGNHGYGPFDIMSSIDSTVEAIEMNSWNRYLLGWLTDKQIQCQEKSNLTSSPLNFSIESIGVDSQNAKAVMVKLDSSNILVLEARSTAGLDVMSSNDAGVLVYKVDVSVPTLQGMGQTYPRPGARSDNEAPLHVGDSITVQGVKITVTAKQGDNYSVSLSAG